MATSLLFTIQPVIVFGLRVGYFQARRSVSCRRSSQSDGRQAKSQHPNDRPPDLGELSLAKVGLA